MQLTEGAIDLVPGTCVWMRPGRTYVAQQDPEDRLGVSFCHFTRASEGVGSAEVPPFEVTQVRSLELAQSMMAEVVRQQPNRPEMAARLLSVLLEVFAEDHHAEGVAHRATRSPHHGRMHSLAAQIAEEPGRSWTVADLAKREGFAPDHFSRVFRDLVGRRPQTYILDARMARARQLLKETPLSVGEIAQVLGFRDVFYFSRQFRAASGEPPSKFRRGRGIIPVHASESSA
jgi:AraC-like DNA-binding protein